MLVWIIRTFRAPCSRACVSGVVAGIVAAIVAGGGALGCAAGNTPAPEAPKAVEADPAADMAAECHGYAGKMCERLGAESEACQAVTEVVGLLPPSACKAALDGVSFSYARVDALRQDCVTVADKLCERIGPDSEVCSKVRQDMQASVPPGHCGRLLQAYPEIEARLMAQLERERPLSAEQQAALLVGEAPSFGPADAKVTLVEFSDFQCPYCAMAAEAVAEIKAKYGDRVRFVFRQFPLSFHEHAQAAAEASLAAHAQGKFWALHDLLFKNQNALDATALRGYAEEAGLDMQAYDKATAEGTYGGAVKHDLTLGEGALVSGTPTLFLNGQRVPNPTDFEAVEPLIQAALAAAE